MPDPRIGCNLGWVTVSRMGCQVMGQVLVGGQRLLDLIHDGEPVDKIIGILPRAQSAARSFIDFSVY